MCPRNGINDIINKARGMGLQGVVSTMKLMKGLNGENIPVKRPSNGEFLPLAVSTVVQQG